MTAAVPTGNPHAKDDGMDGVTIEESPSTEATDSELSLTLKSMVTTAIVLGATLMVFAHAQAF